MANRMAQAIANRMAKPMRFLCDGDGKSMPPTPTPTPNLVLSVGMSDNSEPEKDLPKRVGFGFGVIE